MLGKVYHEMEKKTLHFTHKMNYRKGSSLTTSKMLVLACIVCFVITFISIGLIIFESNYNIVYNRQAISTVQHGTEITHVFTKMLFAIINFAFEDEIVLNYDHEEMYHIAKNMDPMEQFASFRYGSKEAGYYNLFGMSKDIDAILTSSGQTGNESICTSNWTITNYTNDDINCMSLDEMVDIDVFYITKLIEDFYHKKSDPISLLLEYTKLLNVYFRTRTLSNKAMLKAVDYFNSKINERMISSIACALFAIVVISIYITFKFYSKIVKENVMMTMMFNGIPCEVLEGSSQLSTLFSTENST